MLKNKKYYEKCAADKISFEWSHHKIFSTDFLPCESTAWRYFIWKITLWDFINKLKS